MTIFSKKKLKGKISGKIFSTACQDYSPEMKEFIFAIRGRPFAMLHSQKLPVPPVSLIDYDLVRDLGLEMKDLQCTKHTFGGQKMRILGRISQTLQTIQDGAVSGTAHVRANVVENLYKIFDTHSIAGQQVLASLQPPSDHLSDVESSPGHRSQPEPEFQERQAPRGLPLPPAPPPPVKTVLGRVCRISATRGTELGDSCDIALVDGTKANIIGKELRARDTLKVNDFVLVNVYPEPVDGIMAGHDNGFHITKIFTKEEEAALTSNLPPGTKLPPRVEAPQMTKDDLYGEAKSPKVTKDNLYLGSPKMSKAGYNFVMRYLTAHHDQSEGAEDCHGRVLRVRTSTATGRSLVEVDSLSNGKISSHKVLAPRYDPEAFDKLKVGDAVLCRRYPSRDAALLAGHGQPFTILQVLDEPDVTLLRQLGAAFPDVPPDLRPSGYYG